MYSHIDMAMIPVKDRAMFMKGSSRKDFASCSNRHFHFKLELERENYSKLYA